MAPELKPLESVHDISSFDCGNPALNSWLQTTAMQHQKNGMSRTFVALDEKNPGRINGFVTLAVRTLTSREELPASMRKKLPRTVPGYTVARLAVDRTAQGRHLGEYLLIEAMERAYSAAKSVGGFALFVDAKEGAAAFYQRYGFVPLPNDPDTLILPFASMPDFGELS
ncbi:GNAT family N-acetyltransferase [Massilia endophytica]|uniref:GNAT family N-acetyltransferase n=1 Tax=Massilia endophytica TaxID=2899220 RepID=UPI001E4E5B2F|nr:GNAT family N-acetyltransferase [Massilia endophytica]UGQ45386.1 GNAT family N-acetyltransferase [Massilia endophytica]